MQTKYGYLKTLRIYELNPSENYRYDYQLDSVVFAETGEVLDISEVIEHLNTLSAYVEALKEDLDNKDALLRRLQTISNLIEEHYDQEKQSKSR